MKRLFYSVTGFHTLFDYNSGTNTYSIGSVKASVTSVPRHGLVFLNGDATDAGRCFNVGNKKVDIVIGETYMWVAGPTDGDGMIIGGCVGYVDDIASIISDALNDLSTKYENVDVRLKDLEGGISETLYGTIVVSDSALGENVGAVRSQTYDVLVNGTKYLCYLVGGNESNRYYITNQVEGGTVYRYDGSTMSSCGTIYSYENGVSNISLKSSVVNSNLVLSI